MRYKESERFGFPRSFFPVRFRSHEIHILNNDAYVKVDERFQYHITLHCPKCDMEHTVRGRLPPEYDDHEYRAALAKLIALGYFKNECATTKKNYSYHGP